MITTHALHEPESCASCARADCRLSHVSRDIAPVAERTAWIVDEVWPEHRTYVDRHYGNDDQLLSPGLLGKPALGRYDWGRGNPVATLATAARHLAMRKVVNARGSVRQAAYLQTDEALAKALMRHIDYRAGHLVVSQTFLPFLWREGVLGGRSFDVLLTRYPLADLHARLDAVHYCYRDSTTIADFRASEALVAAETQGLAQARRLVTPHHDIAESFSDRALWLDWQRPVRRPRLTGTRTAFLGPVITRQGAQQVRDLAREFKEPLVVFGAELEDGDFWGDIVIDHRDFGPRWLDGIGTILHPAAITHAPRRLVEAIVHGVTVYAYPSCGLAPGQYRPFDEALTEMSCV